MDAGRHKSAGVFKIDPASGSVTRGFSVSAAARSLAESPDGTLAVALGTKNPARCSS